MGLGSGGSWFGIWSSEWCIDVGSTTPGTDSFCDEPEERNYCRWELGISKRPQKDLRRGVCPRVRTRKARQFVGLRPVRFQA